MTAQQLKNSILQMAVQGKLVPQDPNDEPASVLLERIRKEKEKMIKEGKIKKEKNPSIIFRGEDNLPYEKVGKNEPVCIADEVPFEIPESWEWVRLSSIINLQSGQDLTPDKYNDIGDGIPYITGASNIENENVIINRWTEYGRAFAYKGDLLLTCKGTVGTMAFLQEEQVHIARQIMAIKAFDTINPFYIKLVLETLVEDLKAAAKSMIPGISREDVLTALVPLPPIDEQRRIVSRLQAISPYIDTYNIKESKLNELNNSFPELLKKSILQQAVMGKLVPQDDKDEPASILLEKIRTEKEALIKAGKLKKDKHESIIYRRDNSHYEKVDGKDVCIDKEIPFEIPDSWSWTRFSNIAVFENGDRSDKYPVEADYVDDGIPFFGAKDMGDRYMKFDSVRYITEKKYNELGNRKLQDSDMICLLRGNVGKTRIFKKTDKYQTGFICAQMLIIRCIDTNMLDYLYMVISSPYYAGAIESKITGTAVRQLPAKEVANILIPVPPIIEQSRIIRRVLALLKPLKSF